MDRFLLCSTNRAWPRPASSVVKLNANRFQLGIGGMREKKKYEEGARHEVFSLHFNPWILQRDLGFHLSPSSHRHLPSFIFLWIPESALPFNEVPPPSFWQKCRRKRKASDRGNLGLLDRPTDRCPPHAMRGLPSFFIGPMVAEMCQIDACSAPPPAGLLLDLEHWSKFDDIGYYGSGIQLKLRVIFLKIKGVRLERTTPWTTLRKGVPLRKRLDYPWIHRLIPWSTGLILFLWLLFLFLGNKVHASWLVSWWLV